MKGKIIKIFGFILILTVLFSCITRKAVIKVTPEDEVYLNKVQNIPLEFIVKKDELVNVRAKARVFIETYGKNKVLIDTDCVIQSENEKYIVIFESVDSNSIKITVIYDEHVEIMTRNKLHIYIFAYYLQTGEINPKFLQ
ncbi:hypothetical protein KAU33_12085 [Candidatus Dependentiae bacterium]|nr:hypothetical protein [Candidatus Dependentiae bacterium]